jgi:hypothetical protein
MRGLIAIALACCLNVAASEPLQPQRGPQVEAKKQPESPADSKQQSKADQGASQPNLARVGPIQAAPPKPECEHGCEEGTEFWPSLFGYRLKITDTLLVLFTFLLWVSTRNLWTETKAAGRIAKTSADAAKTSSDALMLSERAYLTITFEMPGVRWNTNNRDGLFLSVRVQNFGRTPAAVTDIRIGLSVRDNGDLLPLEFPYPNREQEDACPNGILVPGDHLLNDLYLGLRQTARESVQASEKRLWLFGHVDYIDIFGKRRRAGLVRLYERALEGRADSTNLMSSTERRYDFDRERNKGEGNDWGEETST